MGCHWIEEDEAASVYVTSTSNCQPKGEGMSAAGAWLPTVNQRHEKSVSGDSGFTSLFASSPTFLRFDSRKDPLVTMIVVDTQELLRYVCSFPSLGFPFRPFSFFPCIPEIEK